MLNNLRIAFIGPGAMAGSMIRGLLSNQLIPAMHLKASGPRQARNEEFEQQFGIATSIDNASIASDADIIVLSVKPQVLPSVLNGLQGKIPAHALVISIIAGARMEGLSDKLEHQLIVRAMPNTPAQIGQGITVWTAREAVKEVQREQAKTLLSALGQEIYLAEENYLDMATALSGTGPAYVFAFMEAMVDAGVHLGFPRYVSEQLVLQTVKGSAEYAMHNSRHLARLRNEVTSPGGTSAEALYYLEKAGFKTAVSRAIFAAYERSVELGRK
jgi:pyrroline-5-carboxylate reductase